jgi:anthranilate synthase component I
VRCCARTPENKEDGNAGKLKKELDAWDALRAALPVGTVSGAPKVRAMQIIDELEVNRRGPYSGGYGYVSFSGNMDMALALRTMVIPTSAADTLVRAEQAGDRRRREWKVLTSSLPFFSVNC